MFVLTLMPQDLHFKDELSFNQVLCQIMYILHRTPIKGVIAHKNGMHTIEEGVLLLIFTFKSAEHMANLAYFQLIADIKKLCY